MGNMSKIKQKLDKIDALYEDGLALKLAIIKELKKIQSSEDNPRIERLSSSPKGFTISSKDLSGNWSPFFHDFKAQYQAIIDKLNETGHLDIRGVLFDIAKGKSFNSRKLHPDVCARIKELLL